MSKKDRIIELAKDPSLSLADIARSVGSTMNSVRVTLHYAKHEGFSFPKRPYSRRDAVAEIPTETKFPKVKREARRPVIIPSKLLVLRLPRQIGIELYKRAEGAAISIDGDLNIYFDVRIKFPGDALLFNSLNKKTP